MKENLIFIAKAVGAIIIGVVLIICAIEYMWMCDAAGIPM